MTCLRSGTTGLCDVTVAVEYRADPEEPLDRRLADLRSLAAQPLRFLRLKAELGANVRVRLEVDSVWSIYKAADWLERECFDMFGITFRGHPDLRRILMWEQYHEGYPLRKDFRWGDASAGRSSSARRSQRHPESRCIDVEELVDRRRLRGPSRRDAPAAPARMASGPGE